MSHSCDGASLRSLDSSVYFSEMPAGGDSFLINVGGRRFALPRELLASYPDTRLGELARRGRQAAPELCDDANLLNDEFFFDRNSQTFQYVMNFYRTGRLQVCGEQCEVSFLQEIQYWRIDEPRLHACCRRRREERPDGPGLTRPDRGHEDFADAACPALRRRLWDFLEEPGSTRAARAYCSLSVFFVVLSVVNMVLISLDLGQDFGAGVLGVGAPLLLDALEYVCVAWFTGELLLRFVCAGDKRRFGRSVPNLIDLLAVLPFYLTLALEKLRGGSTELENVGRVVQVLRLLRSLRMLKLGRHSAGLRSLGLTMAQCYQEVGVLLLFLGVGISIFASALFALERDLPGSTFSSVPAAWWWATTSMTTVGYGDVRPDTAAGKVLAFLCILSGILILALPIAIINDRFSACYCALKTEDAAARHRTLLSRLDRRSLVSGDGDLRDGDLRDGDLRDVNLRDGNLRDGDLRDGDLRDGDLRDVNLRDGNLRDGDLRDGDLRDGDLRDGDLRDVDLRDADLRDVDLRDGNLRDAYAHSVLDRLRLRGGERA